MAPTGQNSVAWVELFPLWLHPWFGTVLLPSTNVKGYKLSWRKPSSSNTPNWYLQKLLTRMEAENQEKYLNFSRQNWLKSTYIFFWDFLSSFEKMSVAHVLWIRFGHNLQIAPPKESFSHLKKGVSSPHLLRASKASSVFNDRPVWSKEKIVRRLKENLSVRPSII